MENIDNFTAFVLTIIFFDALSLIVLQKDPISKKYNEKYGHWRKTLFRYFIAFPMALIMTVTFIYLKNNNTIELENVSFGIFFALLLMFILLSYIRIFTDLSISDRTITALVLGLS